MSSTEKKKTKKSKSSKQKERAVDPLAGSGIPPIQADWVQRDWIEEVNTNMKRIVDFLNRFEISTRYRLSVLNQKISNLERQMDFLEQQVESTKALQK